MSFDELNDEQRLELKQQILVSRNEARGEGTSYGELSLADDLVSDEDAKEWFAGTEFSKDDFACSAGEMTEFTIVDKIPQWAVGYIVNSDDSGLEPIDKEMVDDYLERLMNKERLRLTCPIDGTDREFESRPAFGLACSTVDFYAEKLKDDKENSHEDQNH